jgi:hypothetical protein
MCNLVSKRDELNKSNKPREICEFLGEGQVSKRARSDQEQRCAGKLRHSGARRREQEGAAKF